MTAINLFHPSFMDYIGDITFQHTCSILKVTPGVMDEVGQYSAATWAVDQANVPCVFQYVREVSRFIRGEGTTIEESLIVVLPSTVNIGTEVYRIQTTVTGFTGTYEVVKLRCEDMGNWIATLEKAVHP